MLEVNLANYKTRKSDWKAKQNSVGAHYAKLESHPTET